MLLFITNMWVMKRVTAEQINAFVAKAYITQQEANMLLATPQI